MNQEHSWNELVIALIAIFLAFIGGITKHFSQVLEKEERLSWSMAAMHGFIGAFTGALAVLYLLSRGYNDYIVIASAGIAGVGGAALLKIILEVIVKKIGGKNEHK